VSGQGGNAIQGVGVLSLFAGVYLIYASVTNQAPIQTLVAIVRDPANARQTLASRGAPISTRPLTGRNAAIVEGGGGPAIVAFARAQIGKPYASPGDSVNTWDCSGLTKAAVKAGTGINLVHSATAQSLDLRGRSVKREDLQAGDILFPTIGHCGVVSSPTTYIHAPTWGQVVKEQTIHGFISARRFSAPIPTVADRVDTP
jgi:cell wall-associated NlpC family hydrolase